MYKIWSTVIIKYMESVDFEKIRAVAMQYNNNTDRIRTKDYTYKVWIIPTWLEFKLSVQFW